MTLEMSPEEIYDFAEAEYKFAERVAEELAALGVDQIPRPGASVPPPPKKLADMDDRDLGDLYDEFMEWYTYLSGKVSELRRHVRVRDEWRKFVVNFLTQKVLVATPKSERTALAAIQPGYVEANSELARYEEVLAGVNAEMKRVSKSLIQISRHVTLRMDATRLGQRGENIRSMPQNRGYAPRKPT